MATDEMRAVVFAGKLQLTIEKRPKPTIQAPTDVVVKVQYTALCGSELHVFRGHQPSGTGFIMGHEFTGEVIEVGQQVKNLKKGDHVVSPFTISCGECFYCKRGCSSRCSEGKLFGSASLDGGQAEYVRVPVADATLVAAPTAIDPKMLVVMADIFPTGYFAASNALSTMNQEEIQTSTVVLLGCGPVGICALISALEFKPRHILAIDNIQSRLDLAESLGAESWNFQTQADELQARIKELTDGRGADVVIEVVGLKSALKLAFDILRPWGVISSVGVHNEDIPWTANQAYGKNLRIQMGRCPVRSIFEQALALLVRKQDTLKFMISDIRPLSEAIQAYDDFNNMRSQKIIFDATR